MPKEVRPFYYVFLRRERTMEEVGRWLSAQLQDGGKGGADGRVRGIRVVEVVVRGTRTEGCEAGQFDVAGGAWSERHAHRSRQLLKREGGEFLPRLWRWMGWPEAVWRVGSQACILVGRGEKIPGLRMRGTGWSVRV